MKVVSLFSGAGGLDLGLHQVSVRIAHKNCICSHLSTSRGAGHWSDPVAWLATALDRRFLHTVRRSWALCLS